MYEIAGAPVGVNICEDIWYPGDPTETQAQAGARGDREHQRLALPRGKRAVPRGDAGGARASDYGVYVCYTNQVGGQDELVFDGGSMVIRRPRAS